jgi:hypothetical protein
MNDECKVTILNKSPCGKYWMRYEFASKSALRKFKSAKLKQLPNKITEIPEKRRAHY